MRWQLWAAACLLVAAEAGAQYPRIGNLWGTTPALTDYDRLARYGLLVMGGGSPEVFRKFRAQMRTRRSRVVVLGTAPLMNLGAPKDTPWMRDEWYLRRPDGSKVVWWADQIYTPNLLADPCLDALVDRTAKDYGDLVRDGTLDGVFYDSVVGAATWLGPVDTDGDGRPDAAATVDPEWHARQCMVFDRLRERWPGVRILANDVDLGHAPHLNGRLFEGGPLLDQVANRTLGVREAVNRLNGWMSGSRQPGLTFAIMTHPVGWQGWRVGKGDRVTTPGEADRVGRDFPRMRLGLLTTLMTDAYYAYDVGTIWYGSRFWYAEYDAPLGQPRGPAREVFSLPPAVVLDWRAGQPASSLLTDPTVRTTPSGLEARETDVQAAWRRVFGTDARKVRFMPGETYRIEAECAILRRPTGTLQFNLRTARGGWESHDKGIRHNDQPDGGTWRLDVTVTPDDFDDYQAEWHLLGAGTVRLERLRITRVSDSYFVREFDGGLAALNPGSRTITIPLSSPMRRLRDSAAPLHVLEVDDGGAGFRAQGAWQEVGGEGHFVGEGCRRAAKPGSVAAWAISAPSTDRYTIYASVPGGKGCTDAAAYSLLDAATGRPVGGATSTLDQRTGDGGWVRLFTARLRAGTRYRVLLRSGGVGATVADAVRLESAARYNDGARVASVQLAPLDGTILLKGAAR